MTRAEYNAAMSKNPLWRMIDTNDYRRGQEIQNEITTDEDENPFFEGDDEHEEFQTRQTGLIIRNKRELI